MRVEHERVHGTYRVPIGLASGAAAVCALFDRVTAVADSPPCALSVADALEIGRRLVRRLLRQRITANVVAEQERRR